MIGTSAMMLVYDTTTKNRWITLVVAHVQGVTRYFAIENGGRNIALNGYAFAQEFKALCEELGINCTY
jgi:hypothetical protein